MSSKLEEYMRGVRLHSVVVSLLAKHAIPYLVTFTTGGRIIEARTPVPGLVLLIVLVPMPNDSVQVIIRPSGTRSLPGTIQGYIEENNLERFLTNTLEDLNVI